MRRLAFLPILLCAAAAQAQAPEAKPVANDSMVVTVVNVPTPPGLDDARIAAGMHASVEQYRALPGLVRKYYTIGQGSFGGVYLWRNRSAAEAWFNAAWHERAIRTYGRDGTVTYYAVPATVDGARP